MLWSSSFLLLCRPHNQSSCLIVLVPCVPSLSLVKRACPIFKGPVRSSSLELQPAALAFVSFEMVIDRGDSLQHVGGGDISQCATDRKTERAQHHGTHWRLTTCRAGFRICVFSARVRVRVPPTTLRRFGNSWHREIFAIITDQPEN
jgi:hypothetical protein